VVINVKNLYIIYKNNSKIIKAVKNINFSLDFGEYLCIVGNNGSGKSSLMKALLGLVPISGGNIKLGVGKSEIAYLPQINTIPLDFPATVQEIVLSGTQKNTLNLFYKKQDFKNADHALEFLDLIKLKNRRFGDLSGGQQQRVLLARALAKKPKLLFLDEPCAGLDETVTRKFYNILENLNKNNKTTIVMISHDSCQVENYSSKVLYLNKEILFYGNSAQWISSNKKVGCVHY